MNEIQLGKDVTDIEPFHYEFKQYKGVLVAMKVSIIVWYRLVL